MAVQDRFSENDLGQPVAIRAVNMIMAIMVSNPAPLPEIIATTVGHVYSCLLYTSDAADE